eukprot:TRINITY_DN20826_c0_g1_i1.p1 TRINITY_DN20826_c0_g1~~TRINITY_DN20826_c0_g1_i1.p1  ORF type:complete len:304 (-),score=22.88 TRINITY_DN20826_c0_g1_i1:142-1053(-)
MFDGIAFRSVSYLAIGWTLFQSGPLLLASYRPRSAHRPGVEAQADTHGSKIRVACVGDSITFGYRGWAPPSPDAYPTVLQDLLGDRYNVTNLGNPGKTAQKDGRDGSGKKSSSASYWETAEFKELVAAEWDIVVIQLGTNDAKDESCGGPPNWKHELCNEDSSSHDCPYSRDLAALIDRVRTLGSPDVFINVPPPVMKNAAYTINQTVVNHILPRLIPRVAAASGIAPDHILDMYGSLGGKSVAAEVPQAGCSMDMPRVSGCRYFCDATFCDQVHPDDEGFRAMAAVAAGAIAQHRPAGNAYV